MEIDWWLTLVALVVGTLVGLTGVGAGAIMTPVLVGFFGQPISVAVATDLLFATLTKSIGVALHHRGGSVNWSVARTIWWGSIPGSLVGVALVLFVVSKEQSAWLNWPLVGVVLFTAVVLARRALGYPRDALEAQSQRPIPGFVPVVGGFGIGAAVSLTSVGAGALGMALLVRLFPPGEKPQNLVGTDLVHAIPLALIAGVAYGAAGLVSWPLLSTLLLGSVPGVIVGTVLTGRISPRLMQGILSLVLVFVVIVLVAR